MLRQQVFDNDVDARSAVGVCPARQSEVFIVPVRYALAELPAESRFCQPSVNTQSQPMALRRLRSGYLYLWHQRGPLRRFAVADDGLLVEQTLDAPGSHLPRGNLAGFSLDKRQDAWLLFSEISLPPAAHQALAASTAERAARMRHVPLREVATCLEATHCPALSRAEVTLAELMPVVREQALAHDHAEQGEAYREGVNTLGQRMMAVPSLANIQAYIHARSWLSEREQAAARHPRAAEHPPGDWSAVAWNVAATDAWLSTARAQAGSLHAVLVALDDDPGVLRDLNQAQHRVNEREEQWDEENAHRALIAGFINSLITEDGAELSKLINYRYRERNIQLTSEQGEVLLRVQRQLMPLFAEEAEVNQHQRLRIGHAAADAKIADIHRREQVVLAPTRAFIPADLHGQLQAVVMGYRAGKARNLSDSRMGAQVAERVHLVRMQQWLSDVAQPHQEWLVSRRAALYQDTSRYLDRHGKALWFVDFDNIAHCDWLSELSLNSLSALCSSGPGVELATNLLRAPSADQPFSLLGNGFTPSLMEMADRAVNLDAALSSPSQAALGQWLGSQVASGKLLWLSDLGGPNGTDWAQAVSRLSAAFSSLQVEHLAGSAAPANLIQRFPASLRGLLVISRLCSDTVFTLGAQGLSLTGSTGQTLWSWSRAAAQTLHQGLTPAVSTVKSLDTLGGILPLAALLLHLNNVSELKQRDQGLEHDETRRMEHLSESLKVGAALSAVIGAAWEATGQVEVSRRGWTAPVVTLFGTITGVLSSFAAVQDLRKLFTDESERSKYREGRFWGRLGHDSGVLILTVTQSGLGGYATYMAVTSRWTTEQAIRWFTLRMVPISWLLLLVEGLYLAWNYFKDSELQAFLEQCCWGVVPRWGESTAQRREELQVLIELLFKPKLRAIKSVIPASQQLGGSGNQSVGLTWTDSLELTLPGADPQSTALFVKVVAVDRKTAPVDCTELWLRHMDCQWLAAENGIGMRLAGSLPRRTGSCQWHVQVLYYCPLATPVFSSTAQSAVGGSKGITFIVNEDSVTEHGASDGALISDDIPAIEVRLKRPDARSGR